MCIFFCVSEQRRYSNYPVRQPHSGPFLLWIPHPLRHPRQDIRCLPSQYVPLLWNTHLFFFSFSHSSPITVPNPVLGGVTTFLFASVATSGVRVLSYIRFTRRDRFILAAALSFGIGDLLVPTIFTHLFDSVKNPNKGLQGLFNSITIILSTPFLVAGIVAVVLNLILPQEDSEDDDDDVIGIPEVIDVEAHEAEKVKHQ